MEGRGVHFSPVSTGYRKPDQLKAGLALTVLQ